MHLNAVRIGSGFTGRISFNNSMGLRKIGHLKANITEIKELSKGFNVGYSNIYTTKRKTKIAIVPCGYADGVNIQVGNDMLRTIDKLRYLNGDLKSLLRKQKLYVTINQKKIPIIGRVGTFHVTLDISDTNIKIGDEVEFNTNIKFVNPNIRREWE